MAAIPLLKIINIVNEDITNLFFLLKVKIIKSKIDIPKGEKINGRALLRKYVIKIKSFLNFNKKYQNYKLLNFIFKFCLIFLLELFDYFKFYLVPQKIYFLVTFM